MEKFDLRGMEGGKRNAARHWNEYLEWKEALKDNDTVQEGWTHEYVDRNVLMAKVVPWLAGHVLSYSIGLNAILGAVTGLLAAVLVLS